MEVRQGVLYHQGAVRRDDLVRVRAHHHGVHHRALHRHLQATPVTQDRDVIQMR